MEVQKVGFFGRRAFLLPRYFKRTSCICHDFVSLLAFVFVLLVQIQPAYSQQRIGRMSGSVVDSFGNALANVTVSVSSMSGEVISTGSTDGEGFFELTGLPTKQQVRLTFRSVGYKAYEISNFTVLPEDNNSILVTLENEQSTLDEIVVVGFGTQRKITLTGSVASIETKELKQSAVSNLSGALVGRLPGLIARQASGEPGGNGSSIWLRGQSTYSGGNGPLIMIDGVPRAGFEFIDPNEVESITILKDASSTAVYGVRGANGVVLVTTKRGKEGKADVQFSFENALNAPTRLPEYPNSVEYFRYHRRGLMNDGRFSEAALYTDEFINRYDRTIDWDPALQYEYLYPDVDWIGYMLKDYSMRKVANVNVTGGSPRFKYFVSGSYLNEEGIYAHDDAVEDYNIQAVEQRFNFRSNIDMKISEIFSAELGLSTIVRNRNYPTPNADDYFVALKSTAPYEMPIFNPDGTIAEPARGSSNPYAQLTQRGYKKMINPYLQGTVGVKANLDFITDGLSARTRFSYDAQNAGGYRRTKNYWSYQLETDETYSQVREGQDFLNYEAAYDDNRININPEFYINYDKKIKDHGLSAMLLYRLSSRSQRSTDFINALPFREQGLVSRLAYNYQDKYFAEVNFGYNGSENFIQGRRFGFFPSFSAGWVINREAFLSQASWIDLLKVRASHGKVGNQDPGTRFAYQSQWNLNSGSYAFGYDYQNNMPGAVEGKLGNPLATWETAKMTNLGLDFNIKNGLLEFTGDVFYEKRSGIFTTSSRISSALLGIPAGNLPTINAGVVENKGFELDLKHNKQLGNNFSYFVRGNFTYAKNKILDYLMEPSSDRPWQVREGRSLSEIETYVSEGYFQDDNEIANSASQAFFGVVQPGDVRYRDVNGDGKIDSYDRMYIGKSSEPTSILGAALGFTYKGIDISALFQGAFGRHVFINGTTLWGTQNEFRQVMRAVATDYWTPENRDAAFPRAMSQRTPNNTERSTHYLRNGNYIRLKNMEIGYTFPASLVERLGVSRLRLYANGNNLYTWDHVKLFDPEEDFGSPTYPLMATYNFGINVGF